MEAQGIVNTEDFRQLIARYFTTIKPVNDKTGSYTAEIRVSNYCELSYVITNMLKLCTLALDHETLEVSNTARDSSIDIALILKVVMQLLPLDEIEFLDEINKMLITDMKSKDL
ncbi:hypothetical protein OIU80_03845 [Flavobacterium sp. LS1R47]|uniref:Uncharacterized protein n=1 Tax=Flavobacterium frigoritolerans TaxID=2987686 RepID=A0A9X2ZKH8_9FLAO|nr:hypothetical protein [Flavobacterium frigoritolerans]MCV9931402.1 hypothetical protein [Flavobacterium frigoritolerans]